MPVYPSGIGFTAMGLPFLSCWGQRSRSRGGDLLRIRIPIRIPLRAGDEPQPSAIRRQVREDARPHRDYEEVAGSRRDLEARVGQPRLPPASVLRAGEGVV